MAPGEPRPPHNLEQLVGTGSIPTQWHDQQPLREIMHEKATTLMGELRAIHGPMVSFGLMDQNTTPNQASGFMVDTLSLRPGMQVDYTQGSDSRELERVGLRPIDDTWLNPLEPAVDLSFPVYTPTEEMFRMEEGVGFDCIY